VGDAVLGLVSCPSRKMTDRWGPPISVGKRKPAYRFGMEAMLGHGPDLVLGQMVSPRPFSFFFFFLFLFFFSIFSFVS
jgi:hypothetical protein